MRRTRAAALAVGFMALHVARAAADPAPEPPACPEPCYIHVGEPTTLHSDAGDRLRLPPGYFLDEPTFGKREAELTRSQEAETRLAAENRSLRASAAEYHPGWRTLLGALVLGLAGGAYAAHRWW